MCAAAAAALDLHCRRQLGNFSSVECLPGIQLEIGFQAEKEGSPLLLVHCVDIRESKHANGVMIPRSKLCPHNHAICYSNTIKSATQDEDVDGYAATSRDKVVLMA